MMTPKQKLELELAFYKIMYSREKKVKKIKNKNKK